MPAANLSPNRVARVSTTYLGLLLAVTLLAACTTPPTANPPTVAPALTAVPAATAITEPPSTEIRVAAADALAMDLARQGLFSGALLIAEDGQILLSQGYGLADHANKLANTPQTRFPLGALSKQFTTMGILLLSNEAKLKTADLVCTYLRDCPTGWAAVTLQHLLTQASGIPDYTLATISGTATGSSPTAIIATIGAEPLHFIPGADFDYSNTNFFLLGQVIEKVSGQSYGDFIQDAIFTPLGMTNSGHLGEPGDHDLAVGYSDWTTPAPTGDLTQGGLYSTAEDLYRWVQALDSAQLAPASVFAPMFTNRGAGWFVGTDHGQRVTVFGSGGQGFRSQVARYVDDKVVIIVLTNQESVNPALPAGLLLENKIVP